MGGVPVILSVHKLLAGVTPCVGGASHISAYHNSVLVSELDIPPLTNMFLFSIRTRHLHL